MALLLLKHEVRPCKSSGLHMRLNLLIHPQAERQKVGGVLGILGKGDGGGNAIFQQSHDMLPACQLFQQLQSAQIRQRLMENHHADGFQRLPAISRIDDEWIA